MTSKREVKTAFKLLSFCVIAAGLGVGFVSRAHAGGPCPFIEEAGVPPGSCTWYVQSGAPSSVDGGYQSPFNNLAQVQAASNPGDTIIIVAVPTSVPPLDGGIVLQAGQTLAGGNTAGVPGVAPCSNVLQPSPTPPLLFRCPTFRSSRRCRRPSHLVGRGVAAGDHQHKLDRKHRHGGRGHAG